MSATISCTNDQVELVMQETKTKVEVVMQETKGQASSKSWYTFRAGWEYLYIV